MRYESKTKTKQCNGILLLTSIKQGKYININKILLSYVFMVPYCIEANDFTIFHNFHANVVFYFHSIRVDIDVFLKLIWWILTWFG